MITYLFTKILFEVNKENEEYINLLKANEIWIIPIVNVDGYKYFTNYY